MIKKIVTSLICMVLILQIGILPVSATENSGNAEQAPALKAEAAILMEQKTGSILFDKDSHKKMYPASITKVLTALLVLENINLKDIITVGREINLTELDSSISGLKVGEKLSGHDLIWAMMLPSGNDAAYTAAVTVARKMTGDASMSTIDAVKYFVELMNKRALEIGAKDSHFENPDGYHAENHYSSAYDLALISQAALKNEFFRQVVKTYNYKITDVSGLQTAIKNVPTEWYNKNQMLNKNSKYYYQYAAGIKTGHTSLAGYCLAASAQKDGLDLISVVLKDSVEAERWMDTRTLFDFGFENFKFYTLMKKGEFAGKITAVRKYTNDQIELNAIIDKDFTDIFSGSEYKKIKKAIEWDPAVITLKEGSSVVKLKAPIKKGQIIGKISYTLDGKLLVESRLTADKDSKKGNYTDVVYSIMNFGDTYKFVIIALFVIIAGAVIFVLRARSIRRKVF